MTSFADAEAITPSDSANLVVPTRAIYVGGGDGTLSVVMRAGGNTVTFAGLQTGEWYPLEVTRVNATGTGATGLRALR